MASNTVRDGGAQEAAAVATQLPPAGYPEVAVSRTPAIAKREYEAAKAALDRGCRDESERAELLGKLLGSAAESDLFRNQPIESMLLHDKNA